MLIQVNPINAETVLEFKAKVGDVISYSVVKLTHLSKRVKNLGMGKNIQLNRSIWDIYGNKYTYLEQRGTLYTITVNQVNDSSVFGELSINDDLIIQINIASITSINYLHGFIMKTTSNNTYFEQLSLENGQYELNQNFLYETKRYYAAGAPTFTAVITIHNVWDIKTGWLESCHYKKPDSSLPSDIHPYLYGFYEYEIQNDNLTENIYPSIHVWEFFFLSFITFGSSGIFVTIYLTIITRFMIRKS
jgi:hypothetical protein